MPSREQTHIRELRAVEGIRQSLDRLISLYGLDLDIATVQLGRAPRPELAHMLHLEKLNEAIAGVAQAVEDAVEAERSAGQEGETEDADSGGKDGDSGVSKPTAANTPPRGKAGRPRRKP